MVGCVGNHLGTDLLPGNKFLAVEVTQFEACLEQSEQALVDYFLGKTESAGKLYIYDNNEIRKLEIRSEKID